MKSEPLAVRFFIASNLGLVVLPEWGLEELVSAELSGAKLLCCGFWQLYFPIACRRL
ncbi:hypothetical protein [Shewanella xiamenensis]|uniref:hypothetical protein n=1 Tax=Shewanella xiamenensis TaxID=332186 RepID=UPI0016429117|nr:hypothetical protein [Shewanella xiamenensis]